MQAVVSCALTGQAFPAGTLAGSLRLQLKQNGTVRDNLFLPVLPGQGSISWTFFDVPAGTGYIVEARRMAAGDSTLLGNAVASAPFDIATPTNVTIEVPTSVTVTVS